MSGAFVRESDGEWLQDIVPTMNALAGYLGRENNGIRIYERSTHFHPDTHKEVHVMSNGLSYSVDENNRWYVVD